MVGARQQPQSAGRGGQRLQVGDELDGPDARAGVVMEAGLVEQQDALGVGGQNGCPDEPAGGAQKPRVVDQPRLTGVRWPLIIGR